MSDEKALLGAIWEHPHEDTPRLVYADWLQEHDQPERAEFIRIQIDLARLNEWDEEYQALFKREQKLWKKFAKVWQKGLAPDLKKSPFRRGFVAPSERRNNAKKFCALPPAAFDAAPSWNYYLEGASDTPRVLAKSPHLLRVGKLTLWCPTTPTGAKAFLGSRLLRNVAALRLGSYETWGKPGSLAALAGNAAAVSLADLHIDEGVNDATAALVANSPAFAKLRAFGVYQHKLGPDGLRAIFDSSHLSSLTELTLPSWYREEGVRAIVQTRPKFRLRKLVMYGAWMTDAGVAMIANWPGLESVRSLEIGGSCEVVEPRALAASPYAKNLRELDLGLSRLNRQGALALAKSKTLNLKQLLIRMTPAGEDEVAVAALVKRFGKDAVKVRYPGQRKRN